MKKLFPVLICCCLTTLATAETLKMKDGTLVSGSILSQTEYTLNLATSYGNITLNQREIEEILPDKHRLILKGGAQLIGVILDMDEFNLKLQTDDGATVNVDIPQIVSIEAYDYDRGKQAQQEFVEQKMEQQAAKTAAAAAVTTAAVAGQPQTVEAAGGLTFDSDINQVFNAQKATVVNGQVQTPQAQVIQAAPRPMSEEEAFLKNVKTGAISQQEYAAKAKEELQAKNAKKTPKKTAPVKRIEKNYSKYFSVQAGAMPLNLKLDNSSVSPQQDSLDVGGTSVMVSSQFLWRIKESNLWLGPTASIGNIPNASFPDLVTPPTPEDPNPEIKTNGQILSFGAAAHYYINPANRFAFYVKGSASYEMLSLNYRTLNDSHTIDSNGFAGAAGLGVETWVDDLMIGLEVRQVFAQRQKELKKSASSNTVIQAQLSWKF